MDERVIEDQLLLNREALRTQLNNWLAEFSLADRATTKCFEGLTLPIAQFLSTIETFVSDIKTLEKKQADKNLRNYLIKQLQFDDIGVGLAVDHLIEQRRSELVLDAVNKLGPTEENRGAVANLLAVSGGDDALTALAQRFANYQQALNIETTRGLNLLDVHAGYFKRRKKGRLIRREQKRIRRNEKRTLIRNQKLIEELLTGDKLMTEILNSQLIYVEILGLRSDYQKKVDKLKADEREPSQLMDIFDDVTKAYVRREANRLNGASRSLKALSGTSERLHNLLLDVFDLDSKACNRLMAKLAEYNSLLRENANIAAARTNRAKLNK